MIEIHDKTFEPYLSAKEIQETIDLMSTEMNFLEKENPLFIVILKGSFIFASDLLKALSFDGEVTFMQLKSYDGISTMSSDHAIRYVAPSNGSPLKSVLIP